MKNAGTDGLVMLENPATPERVSRAIQRARAEREAQVSPVGATPFGAKQ